MKINDVFRQLKNYHKKEQIPLVQQTSVASPLFPGQFNYCLDEMHLYEKYGDLISIHEDEHFQKIMPAVRLADYENYFLKNNFSPFHLALFTIGTIGGGHIVSSKDEETIFKASVRNVLEFLIGEIGLDKRRLLITYFKGDVSARAIESGAKREGSKLKIKSDFIVPTDKLSLAVWENSGIKNSQLKGNDTRDNFLTTNWDITSAPWGYRNEILYRMDNGTLLDIATIERLSFKPVIEKQNGINYVVDVQQWDKTFNIDACGIERITLASKGNGSIFEVEPLKELFYLDKNYTNTIIESVRIIHRIFTDSSWQELKISKHRKEKVNKITRQFNVLTIKEVEKVLEKHAKVYNDIFPELNSSIKKVITEVENYRKNRRNLQRTKKKS